MALVSTLTANEVQEALVKAGRDNFSFRAIDLILEYYEEYGENVEFYPVDLDCTFVEYDLTVDDELANFMADYEYLVDGQEFDDEEEKIEAVLEELRDNAFVLCSEQDLVLFDYNF